MARLTGLGPQSRSGYETLGIRVRYMPIYAQCTTKRVKLSRLGPQSRFENNYLDLELDMRVVYSQCSAEILLTSLGIFIGKKGDDTNWRLQLQDVRTHGHKLRPLGEDTKLVRPELQYLLARSRMYGTEAT